MSKKEVLVIMIILLIIIVPVTYAFSFAGIFKGFFNFITGRAGVGETGLGDSVGEIGDGESQSSPPTDYGSAIEGGTGASSEDSDCSDLCEEGDVQCINNRIYTCEAGAGYGEECTGWVYGVRAECCEDSDCSNGFACNIKVESECEGDNGAACNGESYNCFDCRGIECASCTRNSVGTECNDKKLYSSCEWTPCGCNEWGEIRTVECCTNSDCGGSNDIICNTTEHRCRGIGVQCGGQGSCYANPCGSYDGCATLSQSTCNGYCCSGSCEFIEEDLELEDYSVVQVRWNQTNQSNVSYSPDMPNLEEQEALIQLQNNVVNRVKIEDKTYDIYSNVNEAENIALIRINEGTTWKVTIAVGIGSSVTALNNEQNPVGKISLAFGDNVILLNWISLNKISFLKLMSSTETLDEDAFLIILP